MCYLMIYEKWNWFFTGSLYAYCICAIKFHSQLCKMENEKFQYLLLLFTNYTRQYKIFMNLIMYIWCLFCSFSLMAFNLHLTLGRFYHNLIWVQKESKKNTNCKPTTLISIPILTTNKLTASVLQNTTENFL